MSDVDELRLMVAKKMAPLRVDRAGYIWGPSEKGGETVIAQVRGWGYLTGGGHGALGLPSEMAIEIQNSWGDVLCHALNTFAQSERPLKASSDGDNS